MKTTRSLLLSFVAVTLACLGLMGSSQAATPVGKAAAPAPRCMVAEIRGIAFSIHHPIDRYVAITEWLNRNGSACSLEKLQYINSNRPNWFGHSDSAALGQILDQLIETATGAPPKQTVAAEKERSSLLGGTNRADAPPPVVAPAVAGQPPIIVAPVVATTCGAGNKGGGPGAKP
jgi:hypothetical protein